MTHQDYVKIQRARLVAIAKEILTGNKGILEGSREILSLQYEIEDDDANDFRIFSAIESETDHFPVGKVRQYWNPDALKAKDIEISEFESGVKEEVYNACQNFISKFDISK